jgi:uncharacterized DUF497 family protein
MRQRLTLRWTPYNLAHIARHGVGQNEAEDVADAPSLIERSYGGRYLMIGATRLGRMVTVVVEPEGASVYLVITARPASRKERRRVALVGEGGAEWPRRNDLDE